MKLFIFIDGSYLFKASNQNGFHYNIKELPNGLAKRLNYNFNLIKTYYYCSVPDPEYEDDIGKERARKQILGLEQLKKIPLLDVRVFKLRYGMRTLRHKVTCTHCQNEFYLNDNVLTKREKGVDICIAVDMLSQAYNNAYDVALLLTGDSDFVPAIEKVKALGKIVYCAAFQTPPFDKLAKACDDYILLNNNIGGIYPRK